jgi:aryl-alcohol dehydrogenase-like predicted oxidoreductase
MTFGLQSDEQVSNAILDQAFDRGLDFLDTANVYPLGGSLEDVGRTEEILGRWMKRCANRDQLLLATKCRVRVGPGPNDEGLSRHHILRAVEDSLRRLGTDSIDLYQTHFFDPHTPIDETLRALDDLVRSGKVRYIGCSNYPAWRLAEALAASERLGISRYESVQPRYNLLYREIETELLPLCRAQGVGVLVYNPVAGGLLTGKYVKGDTPQDGTRFTLGKAAPVYQRRYWHPSQLEAVEALHKSAQERGFELASVAIAWLLEQPGISSVIIGASHPDQLDASFKALDVTLDTELGDACDSAWWQLPRRPVVEGYW